jgi:hypothetical protein
MSRLVNPNSFTCDACGETIPPQPSGYDHTGTHLDIVPSISLRHANGGTTTAFNEKERSSVRFGRDLCNRCATVVLTAAGYKIVTAEEEESARVAACTIVALRNELETLQIKKKRGRKRK